MSNEHTLWMGDVRQFLHVISGAWYSFSGNKSDHCNRDARIPFWDEFTLEVPIGITV